MTKPSVSMKLLIDTKGKKVLFAEASKDTIDFLFHILSLPVATVVNLLKKNGMVGSLANLYTSIETLNDTYLQSNQTKDAILRPPVVAPHGTSSVPLLLCNQGSSETKFYRCGSNYSHTYVTDDPRQLCPTCNNVMNIALTYRPYTPPAVQEGSAKEGGGYVKGVVTYMVMDNLEVKPMSTISSITMLNKFAVKDVGSLEERVVNLDMSQAVILLRASLRSGQVLTDVFLK